MGARAGSCPHCGRGSLDVKERPVVRVRGLPIAGRAIHPRWRKRRYRCGGCRRTFTESHPELPSRQRVTRRFRRRLRERVAGGVADAVVARASAPLATRSAAPIAKPPTSSPPAGSAVRPAACRWTRLTTAVAASWRRWPPISIAAR